MKLVPFMIVLGSASSPLVFGATTLPRPPALETPTLRIKADQVIDDHLTAIDGMLRKSDRAGAIRASIERFNLNGGACRGYIAQEIPEKDESGLEIVALTRLDQVVVIDPRLVAFKSARYLVSVLAHEITHCEQNQRMYALALAADRDLAPLREKLPRLRQLIELDELAMAATKPSQATAVSGTIGFAKTAQTLGLPGDPKALLSLSRRVLEDVQTYKKSLAELQEMEAALRAFELPGVIPPPRANQKLSEEFAFQFRFLVTATDKLIRRRRLFGAGDGNVCRMGNYVPFEMTLEQERNCAESVRLIQAYIGRLKS